MKPDIDNLVLEVQNGFNGEIKVINNFFAYTDMTKALLIADNVLPLLKDEKQVFLRISQRM